MESVFQVLAEPSRRAILSLLVSSEHSVGEIERKLSMPQPAVSKHLRTLREAGFVEATVDAQRRLYRLRLEPLRELDDWLEPFRRFWSAHLDALERHLDHMDHRTAGHSIPAGAAGPHRTQSSKSASRRSAPAKGASGKRTRRAIPKTSGGNTR